MVLDKIPICGTIYPRTLNQHDFYYNFFKGGPYFLFENFLIGYKIYEPFLNQKHYYL